MSGSPIYINDRLIGAYAYGWDFQTEPVAGVTPIAKMLECTQPGSSTPPTTGSLVPAAHVLKIGNKLISRVQVAGTRDAAARLAAKVDPTTMVLAPVASPVFVSGFSEAGLGPMQRFLAHYHMRAVPGPGTMPGPATRTGTGFGGGRFDHRWRCECVYHGDGHLCEG